MANEIAARRFGQVVRARNAELLDRALDLFLEHGFAATTIEMISASLGMGRRTIYDRFGDKETLFRAALQKAVWDGGDATELDRQTAYRVRLFLEGAKRG